MGVTKTELKTTIYENPQELPDYWDSLAGSNIFLKHSYLSACYVSKPKNMRCYFIVVFEENQPRSIAAAQFLDLNQLETFGERQRCMKTVVRNFVFQKFSSHVLFIGNNMLSGQHAFAPNDNFDSTAVLTALEQAAAEIKERLRKESIRLHVTVFKDFDETFLAQNQPQFSGFFKFTTQPNMIFENLQRFENETDYVGAFAKKYRDQYKRSRKRLQPISSRLLTESDLEHHQKTTAELYFNVAKNAAFNTFVLPENHFLALKKELKDDFIVKGYFLEERLVGFSTIIRNGSIADTYFLGYDAEIQKNNMLYLNMLYDMILTSISEKFDKIVFGRTAMEIKSSAGAVPKELFGFMKHHNLLLDKVLPYFFKRLEPKVVWQQRHPFKGNGEEPQQ
jgi:hypothetical protein